MKKALPVLLLILSSCASQKPAVDNLQILRAHQGPIKISNVGYWGQNYNILTLLDAKNQYFTIRTLRNDSVKIGDTYSFE